MSKIFEDLNLYFLFTDQDIFIQTTTPIRLNEVKLINDTPMTCKILYNVSAGLRAQYPIPYMPTALYKLLTYLPDLDQKNALIRRDFPRSGYKSPMLQYMD